MLPRLCLGVCLHFVDFEPVFVVSISYVRTVWVWSLGSSVSFIKGNIPSCFQMLQAFSSLCGLCSFLKTCLLFPASPVPSVAQLGTITAQFCRAGYLLTYFTGKEYSGAPNSCSESHSLLVVQLVLNSGAPPYLRRWAQEGNSVFCQDVSRLAAWQAVASPLSHLWV